MKKFKIIVALFLAGLASTGVNAQRSTQNNYGYQYSGYTISSEPYIPSKVRRVVGKYHHHHGYNWVGTIEFERGHRRFFVLTFNKGRHYLELTVNRRGDIIKRHKYVIDYRKRRPQRRIYTNRKIIQYHDGYAYSRRGYRHQYEYPWDHDWKNWDNK